MTKRLAIKIGEYEKDGETKGEYANVGVILSGDNGEFLLLDPTINLAGCLIKQRLMNPEKSSDMVMCSVFDSDRSNNSSQSQGSDNKPAF